MEISTFYLIFLRKSREEPSTLLFSHPSAPGGGIALLKTGINGITYFPNSFRKTHYPYQASWRSAIVKSLP